ncbi:helitron_like_N domain-containing protein [Trichonephila clavata]|uniref:Helitron_like_N domain-containing protein n=1 Tax=Trichonephila clavata TaxID=2740835 RepID=A0A8X6IPP7_TRICU|nr:helitron_like_N domain-containing protein [Trichonephila clavata]
MLAILPKTTLTESFELCNLAAAFGPFARKLLYSEVPRYFTRAQTKKNGFSTSKAHRLMHSPVYSNQKPWGEYLQSIQGRLSVFTCDCCWLMYGPLSFQDIRNGQQYSTYKDGCLALDLMEDDNQWDYILTEAALN